MKRARAIVTLISAVAFTAFADNPDNPDDIEAAGCLIATPDGFVISLNRLLNRLQLPAGKHEAGESARQTAARETLEETGLEVVVGETAFRLKDRRVTFFYCRPKNPSVNYSRLQAIDRVEVSRVMVINPIKMTTPGGEVIETRWRFAGTRWLLAALFGSIADHRD